MALGLLLIPGSLDTLLMHQSVPILLNKKKSPERHVALTPLPRRLPPSLTRPREPQSMVILQKDITESICNLKGRYELLKPS